MAMDTPDIDDQGREMLRRAAAPGVTHGGLAVPRQAIGSGAALASEIQRRWTPADPAGWGNGPALHYAGQVPAGGPVTPAAPVASSAPKAQVVGQAASPAAQATAAMGASVQRQHLGTPVAAVPERTPRTAGTTGTARTDAAPLPVVRRKTAEAPVVQRQAAAAPAAASSPALPVAPAAPVAAAPQAADPQAEAPASSGTTILGPAIVRRSAARSTAPSTPAPPAMPLRREAGSLSREAGEGRGGGSSTTPAASASPVMGPAIVRRSAEPLT